MLSVDTLTGSSMVTARPTLSRQGHSSTAYLRSSMGPAYNNDTRSINSGNSGNSNSNEGVGFGKRVGGWVFGRWGVSPAKSTDNFRPKATPTQRVVSQPVDPLKAFTGRRPGINQKGPIPGFVRKNERAPSNVKPAVVDHDALRDILSEGAYRGYA